MMAFFSKRKMEISQLTLDSWSEENTIYINWIKYLSSIFNIHELSLVKVKLIIKGDKFLKELCC